MNDARPIADDTVPPAEMLARARALVPRLRERAEACEAERRVSRETIDELIDAGLFRIVQPRAFGGFEYGLDDFVDLVVEVAGGCGSTGWVYANSSKYQWLVGMFPPEAQHDMWDNDPRAITASSFNPSGVAVPVDGGFRINGTWMYCSGIDNCQWIILACKVAPETGGEPTSQGYVLVPTQDGTLDDNWRVVGLAGTGSKNFICTDLFVPAHRFLSHGDAVSGAPPGARLNTGPLFRIPIFSAISVSLCAAIMGMARGACEDFVEGTRDRMTRGAAISQPLRMAELPTIQLRIGEAAGCIDAARTLVARDCRQIMATAAAGETLTVAQRARNKGDLGYAAKLSLQALDRLFEAGGGGGLFSHGRVQRLWRDAHAGAMHVSMNWDAVGALYGRVTLGLPPGPAQF